MTLRPQDRDRARDLYWAAFGAKLGKVMGPAPKAMHLLDRCLRLDHAIGAYDGDTLVGIVGFKTRDGAFFDPNFADMRAVYGLFGAAWRGLFLDMLGRDIDNERFLMDGICVDQSQRGRGVGTTLLHRICDLARDRGYHAIRLDVIDSNPRARALYERQGFVATTTSHLGPLRHIFGFRSATTMVRNLH